MKRDDPSPGNLRDLGEFGFIDLVRRRYGGKARPGEIGIGDDGAVLLSPRGKVVLSTDLLLEGTHFDLRYFLPEEIGWRALSANLSDLAAMGASPVCYLAALAAPPDASVKFLASVFRGMARAARPSGIRLMGGDTCRGEKIVLSLTVMGKAAAGKTAARRGARPGDILFVTGEPGWSRLGFKLLSGGRPRNPSGWKRTAMRRHLMPSARWREGTAAAGCGAVSAMIDLSDGLLQDLSHLLKPEGMGAVLDEKSFHLSTQFRKAAAELKENPLASFLAGGEDYELLMAVRPHKYESFRRAARNFPAGVFPIGVVTKGGGVRVRRADGTWMAGAWLPRGFTHFPSLSRPIAPGIKRSRRSRN
ncbi:MAG: thiamine-phosphate kinase [Deltaproteobacteria bacterium]|nr:thiamine-phosphate kinase [Deltaproteobacteria bacterium]